MKTKVHTVNAPQAIGPYSQAVKIQNLLFMSGQIPLDPSVMKLVEGDIRIQTQRVLKNMLAVLEESGATFKDVVKTTVFLNSMSDFKAFNEEYSMAFPGDGIPPARTTIQAGALPLGALVEIEAVAFLRD